MKIKCPKCCSDNVCNITEKYGSKVAKTSGAIIGTLFSLCSEQL